MIKYSKRKIPFGMKKIVIVTLFTLSFGTGTGAYYLRYTKAKTPLMIASALAFVSGFMSLIVRNDQKEMAYH